MAIFNSYVKLPVITQFGWFTHVHILRKGWAYRRLIDGTVDDMSILGGHRGSYRIAAGPLPADANPTDCQYDTRRPVKHGNRGRPGRIPTLKMNIWVWVNTYRYITIVG